MRQDWPWQWIESKGGANSDNHTAARKGQDILEERRVVPGFGVGEIHPLHIETVAERSLAKGVADIRIKEGVPGCGGFKLRNTALVKDMLHFQSRAELRPLIGKRGGGPPRSDAGQRLAVRLVLRMHVVAL